MPTIETLRAILSRVESGNGEDRELDLALALALEPHAKPIGDDVDDIAPYHYWRAPPEARGMSLRCADRYTTSIDASFALVERVKPGAGANTLLYALTCLVARNATLEQMARAVIVVLLRAEIQRMESDNAN